MWSLDAEGRERWAASRLMAAPDKQRRVERSPRGFNCLLKGPLPGGSALTAIRMNSSPLRPEQLVLLALYMQEKHRQYLHTGLHIPQKANRVYALQAMDQTQTVVLTILGAEPASL